MKKTELVTIIKKIQNRCYLEKPTKVTYYRNEEGKIAFKIFFDSLCIPEELRIGVSKIQNTFLVQNTYEYEDDFQITKLDQDEGYVEFIPDNQHFKFVHNYKSANTVEDKKEEALVHLAGRSLNESFAEGRGYILLESETEIPTEGGSTNETGVEDLSLVNSSEVDDTEDEESTDTDEQETEEEENQESYENVYVIGVSAIFTKKAEDLIRKCLLQIKDVDENPTLVFAVPTIDELKLDSLTTDMVSVPAAVIKTVFGKSIEYSYAIAKNVSFNVHERFSKANIQTLHYMTNTAKQALIDNNVVALTAVENTVDGIEEGSKVVTDDSAEGVVDALNAVRSKIKGLTDILKSKKANFGPLMKSINKAILQFENAEFKKTIPLIKSLVLDLFHQSDLPNVEQLRKERQERINNAAKAIKNPGAAPIQTVEELLDHVSLAMAAASKESLSNGVFGRKSAVAQKSTGTGMFAGMTFDVAVNASSYTDTKSKPIKVSEPEQLPANTPDRVLAYICFVQKGSVPGQYKTLQQLDTPVQSLLDLTSEQRAKTKIQKEKPEDEDKDSDKKDDESTEDQTTDVENSEETTSDEQTTDQTEDSNNEESDADGQAETDVEETDTEAKQESFSSTYKTLLALLGGEIC